MSADPIPSHRSETARRCPLVLVPGNMCDARVWTLVGAHMTAAGWQWSVAEPSSQYAITDMAVDLLAAHPGQMIVIGFSMGAIVALEMLRQAPERIVGIGLVALNAGADLPERAAARPSQQASVAAGHLARVVTDELLPHYLAEARRGDRILAALTMDMAQTLGPDCFIAQSEALRTRHDMRGMLSSIDVPALLACGAEDRLCPPRWHQQWAQAIGARATTAIIDGAGHLLPLEQPGALADAILAWLEPAGEA